MAEEKIRFAPLIRVSTEGQEKAGESLRTQKQQIISYVESLDGTIPDHCWKYSGQEHATPDNERKMLSQLLEDSGKNKFDAIIVCDASRWSRDNEKSKQGLRILKKNGIRFFVATMEYDLYSPEQSFYLGMSAEISEFQAKLQNLKSMQNKIERAKRGYPTGGRHPYGRIFERKTETWSLDAEKANNIRWASDQYLEGKQLENIAKVINMTASNLWRTLTKCSGDIWLINFNSERLNIHEKVEIKIPELLPKEMIDKIHKRAAANKTYTHGFAKNKYLLSRMLFCGKCGYAMYGQTNEKGLRSYRHNYRMTQHEGIECNSFLVRADDLEKAVLVHLFKTFSDVAGLERAMIRAIPNLSKVKKLLNQKKDFEKQLTKTESKRQRIVKAIADDTLNLKDAKIQMDEIRKTEALLNEEIEKINAQTENVPNEDQIKRKAALTRRIVEGVFGSYSRLGKMSFEDKRKLVQTAFDGLDENGKRLGVHLLKKGDKITYTIKGVVADAKGSLPMSKRELQNILEIDIEEAGDYDPFEDSKQDFKNMSIFVST